MLVNLLLKCEIEYKGNIVSKEHILQECFEFFSNTIDEKSHNVGIIIRPPSICFDILGMLLAVVSSFAFSERKNEDILEDLKDDTIVLYGRTKKQRYKFHRYDDEMEIIELSQPDNGKMLNSLKKENWNRIEPYYGDAICLDGKGINKNYSKRESFIQYALGLKKEDIQSSSDKYTIVMMEKEKADDIINNVKLFFKEGSVSLFDLVNISFFSEKKEYPYRGNPGRLEPEVRITNRVSLVRDLVFETSEAKEIGIIFLDSFRLLSGGTELYELIGRKSLRFVYTFCEMYLSNIHELISEYNDTSLFTSAKREIKPQHTQIVEVNEVTQELQQQIDIIVRKKIIPIVIQEGIFGDLTREIKQDLVYLKRKKIPDDDLDYFIMTSYSLLKLYTTAAFPLGAVEQAIADKHITIESISDKLGKLRGIKWRISSDILEIITTIVGKLESLYLELYDSSLKMKALESISINWQEKRACIVVPKAYYKTIIEDKLVLGNVLKTKNVRICTANTYDNSIMYDEVIVLGIYEGKRFNIFRCSTSKVIKVLLYANEESIFDSMKKNMINKENYLFSYLPEAEADEKEIDFLEIIQNVEKGSCSELETIKELDEMILEINNGKFEKFISNEFKESSDKHIISNKIIYFSDEAMFVSKHYKAYVLDVLEKKVTIKNASDLEIGDTVVFTQNNSETQDIVSSVLELLIKNEEIDEKLKVDYFRSLKWKEVLKKYRDENNLTYKEIAFKLDNIKDKVTIRSWIDDSQHIVGPNELEVYKKIANLTKDSDMLVNYELFKIACDNIRKLRRGILKKIGNSILKGIGDESNEDIISKIVSSQIKDLALILEITDIRKISQSVPLNMINRPVDIGG